MIKAGIENHQIASRARYPIALLAVFVPAQVDTVRAGDHLHAAAILMGIGLEIPGDLYDLAIRLPARCQLATLQSECRILRQCTVTVLGVVLARILTGCAFGTLHMPHLVAPGP